MRRKRFYCLMPLGLILFSWACNVKFSPNAPIIIPPTATPTATFTPACGFTVLPSSFGATTPGLIVIRNTSDWNAYAGATTCATPAPAPIPDFGTQMVLVYPQNPNGFDPRSHASFASACLYPDRMEVTVNTTYNPLIMAPSVMGPCLTQNLAIAVPYTTLPIHFTVCQADYSVSLPQTLIPGPCTTTTY